MTQKSLTGRQARALAKISEFDFEIQHIPGRLNYVADALSRYPHEEMPDIAGVNATELITNIPNKEEIIKAYETDPYFKKISDNITSIPNVTINHDKQMRVNGRLCIPKLPAVRNRILQEVHVSNGHSSALEDYRLIYPGYFWPTLRDDVFAFAKSCQACQATKSAPAKKSGEQRQLPIPNVSFDRVHMDWTGPFPTSKGFDTICIYVCAKSGMTVLAPTIHKSTGKDTAEEFLEYWYPRFGFPKTLVSDRDRRYLKGFLKKFVEVVGIDHRMASTAHPQSNGTAEVRVKYVKMILRNFLADKS